MSLLAVAAGKDTRGVTTTALALAAIWPRPQGVLLAECDPAGGSLAARYGMSAAPGLMTLASAGRRQLQGADVTAHTQTLPGELPVLLGALRAEEAHALGRLWSSLAIALADLDIDVIADCGRLDPDTPIAPILQAADVVLLVCEPTREGVLHLQGRIEALRAHQLRPAVVLLGEKPYTSDEVRQALAQPAGDVDVLGVIAHDVEAAAVLAGRPGSSRSLGRSLLLRSCRVIAAGLTRRLRINEPWAPEADTPIPEPTSGPWGAEAR
jgi:MinD-like ATPase involved in chromosome partitioning or flagellar assembly